MKPVVREVERFGPMHAWANRILEIDLSNMDVQVRPAEPYVPAYLGARGIAARLCWEEQATPAAPFASANPLMIFPGALAGSHSPYSGRSSVCAFSPQGEPHPWFTRSNVGGYFGGELKRAGYDGLVVTGAAETPVRIQVHDDQVAILPADALWGLDTMDTLQALEWAEGKATRSLVIGPAGERLSCIATIQAASSSACGQGGFGAVMGSKKLKAISVIGSGRVSLSAPETIRSIARRLAQALAEDRKTGPLNFYGDIKTLNRELAAEGHGRATCHACTDGCITPCVAYFQDVPGVVYNRKWSGDWVCVGRDFLGFDEGDPPHKKAVYDWQLGRRAAFELNVLSNRYGLNQFDIVGGMVPWLIACQKAGLISEINGQAIDWRSPDFWAEFLRSTAYRQGMGDILAEGGWAAANRLDLGIDLARQRYPGWGYTAHCDPFGWGEVTFPYWLVSALQWLSDTRDPFNSGHGYLWAASAAERAAQMESDAQREAALDRLRALGQRVYRSADAVDPCSGYNAKAYPGFHQTLRSVLKDCLSVDAHFPLVYRRNAPDLFWRLHGIEGIGDIDGPSVEYHLFSAGTGVPWSEAEFEQAAARILTLERALQVRHWARNRQMDEAVLSYFERTEPAQNPFLDRRYSLDRAQFRLVLDEFYALHGWDIERGWPTQERLRELGLGDVHEPMIDGAKSVDKPAHRPGGGASSGC
jgi:aldehyde:ferredoxin oxidoreductase